MRVLGQGWRCLLLGDHTLNSEALSTAGIFVHSPFRNDKHPCPWASQVGLPARADKPDASACIRAQSPVLLGCFFKSQVATPFSLPSPSLFSNIPNSWRKPTELLKRMPNPHTHTHTHFPSLSKSQILTWREEWGRARVKLPSLLLASVPQTSSFIPQRPGVRFKILGPEHRGTPSPLPATSWTFLSTHVAAWSARINPSQPTPRSSPQPGLVGI